MPIYGTVDTHPRNTLTANGLTAILRQPQTSLVSDLNEFTRAELNQLHDDFEAAQRGPLKVRVRSAFIRTCKPVLDEGTMRMFQTTCEYRQWCHQALPEWLGYQSPS